MLCIDLISNYRMSPNKGGRKYAMKHKKFGVIQQQTITMIDPAPDWVKIYSLPEARADLVANQVELARSARCLQPYKIFIDKGNVILAKIKTKMVND